jgi:hypothetical protein
VLIVDIFPFENFIDLMQCVFDRDFVRKVRREHAPLRTDPIDVASAGDVIEGIRIQDPQGPP